MKNFKLERGHRQQELSNQDKVEENNLALQTIIVPTLTHLNSDFLNEI
jgi:hypothetical protein